MGLARRAFRHPSQQRFLGTVHVLSEKNVLTSYFGIAAPCVVNRWGESIDCSHVMLSETLADGVVRSDITRLPFFSLGNLWIGSV